MSTTEPACTSSTDGYLSIVIADEKDILTSTDWATFKMVFRMTVTNPTDYIVGPCTIGFSIADPNSNTLLGLAPTITDFTVIKGVSSTADVSSLVSFGVDSEAAAE